MKTTKSKSRPEGKKVFLPKLKKTDDELAVIRDVISRRVYYMSIIDTFVIEGKEYIVMHNYAPDDGSHAGPELVIMRTSFTDNGEQLFYSIRDKSELDAAFVIFMRRFYSADARKKA